MLFVMMSLPEARSAVWIGFGRHVVLVQVLAFVRTVIAVDLNVMQDVESVGGEFVDAAFLTAQPERL